MTPNSNNSKHFKPSTPRKIDLKNSTNFNKLLLLIDTEKPVQQNISRNITVVSKRFHFQVSKKNGTKRSLFDRSVSYDYRANSLFTFETFDWLSLLVKANLNTPIGLQSDGQHNEQTGSYSSKNTSDDFINYTRFIMTNIDSLKNSYGYLHIKTSATYANTTSLLTAYDWFKDSAFNNFIKSLDSQHEQDKSRLLLVLVYWMNNVSFELFNADVQNQLNGLLSPLMDSIVGKFNPVLKPHENADTTIAELIAQQIFYEYRYTSWQRPDNPFVGIKLPSGTYDLSDDDFAKSVNDNVIKITNRFNKYFSHDDITGFINSVFSDLSKQQLLSKFTSDPIKALDSVPPLKEKFLSSKQFSQLKTISNKEQRWKQLLIELDEFFNSFGVNVNGLLAVLFNIQSLERRTSIKSRQIFWERISKKLATQDEIESERENQAKQRATTIELAYKFAKYLEQQSANDSLKNNDDWLNTQREIYKRQQEILGLPSSSNVPDEILNSIL